MSRELPVPGAAVVAMKSISRRAIKDRCRLLLAQIEFQRAAEAKNSLIRSHVRREGDRELASCMARQEARVIARQNEAWDELRRAQRRCRVGSSYHVDIWGFAERMDDQLRKVAWNSLSRRAPRPPAG